MCIAKKQIEAKFASDNEIASNNKVVLFNLEINFSGFAEVIKMFFPELRHEMLLRYRAETIAKVGEIAYKMAKEYNVTINPIQPKIALPIIEKMSLEYEPDMYDKWAKLLIAAGVNSNPIHGQYAEVLATINSCSANLLKTIYMKQNKANIENEYDSYHKEAGLKNGFEKLKNSIGQYRFDTNNIITDAIGDTIKSMNLYFTYPLIINGDELDSNKAIYTINDKNTQCFEFSQKDINMLMSLSKLGLIKYDILNYSFSKNEIQQKILKRECGLLLTQFGYEFINCLENPINKKG